MVIFVLTNIWICLILGEFYIYVIYLFDNILHLSFFIKIMRKSEENII